MPKSNGVTATAVGTQIAEEATQQAVGNQSNQEAGRDVVITETELEAIGETINIDQSIPPWVLIALVLGWLAPSPSEMGRGLFDVGFFEGDVGQSITGERPTHWIGT